MSVWLAKYRWVFLALTVVFLAFAWYRTIRDGEKTGPWGRRMLVGTTALSIGLVAFTLI